MPISDITGIQNRPFANTVSFMQRGGGGPFPLTSAYQANFYNFPSKVPFVSASVANGKLTVTNTAQLASIAWNLPAADLATALGYGSVEIIDTATGKPVAVVPARFAPTGTPYTPDMALPLVVYNENIICSVATDPQPWVAATQAEAEAGVENSHLMTPLRTFQAFSKALAAAGTVTDLRARGLVCDGNADDTVALQTVINSIGTGYANLIIAQPVKISGNVTFGPNTTVMFLPPGKIIGVNGTEQVYFQRQIVAPDVQIFQNIVAKNSVAQTVLVEWFGAKADGSDDKLAIQMAIDLIQYTGGTVQLMGKTYSMSTNVNIGHADGTSAGSNTTFIGMGQTLTKLNLLGAAASAIQVLGSSSVPLAGIVLGKFSITKNAEATGGVGIYAQYTSMLKASDITCYRMAKGIALLRATNTLLDRMITVVTGTLAGSVGFDLNGGGVGAGGNASSVFTDCYVDASGYTGPSVKGFFAYGAFVSDLLFQTCETQKAHTGFEFDFSTSVSTGNEDIQVVNCRSDGILSDGIYIHGAGVTGDANSMITIDGGWMNHFATAGETRGVRIENSRGVAVRGVEFLANSNAANAYHIKFSNSINLNLSDNIMSDMKYGIYGTASGYNVISRNRLFANAASPAANMIAMVGDVRSLITENVFDGYAAIASFADNTSTGTTMALNTANPTNITTRFSNAAVGGVTQLNAGA